jgi:hypothetical protein
MTYIHSTLFFIHILVGTAALILFWVPMLTKKGQLQHKRFGRAYRNIMYCVAASGALMAIMVIAMPLTTKPFLANAQDVDAAVTNFRYFWLFLLYLALLSYTSTRHGDAVLKAKDNRSDLRAFTYLAPLAMLAFGGLVFIGIGVVRENMLHLIFGILGTSVGISMLRYCLAKQVQAKAYILEHIGSMIGSGIGAYTAFFAFGGRQILSGIGSYQIIFWIIPGVAGSILSFYLSKKYIKVYRLISEQLTSYLPIKSYPSKKKRFGFKKEPLWVFHQQAEAFLQMTTVAHMFTLLRRFAQRKHLV